MNIHYSVTTGDIVSYGSADYEDGQDSHLPGCKVRVVEDQPIDPLTQRIDLVSLEIVAQPPDHGPDPMVSLRAAVAAELAGTDMLMLADYPISDADRELWVTYRRALREASQVPDMLAAIPSRPDGFDAFALFRASLNWI